MSRENKAKKATVGFIEAMLLVLRRVRVLFRQTMIERSQCTGITIDAITDVGSDMRSEQLSQYVQK